jgi:molybdopterin synthase catalytic subunit
VLVVTAVLRIARTRSPPPSFLMDYLKTRAPFWKQIELAGGGRTDKIWVEAKRSDDALADRWTPSSGRRAAE